MFCNTIFPLIGDVYYATQSQNDFGEIEKTWEYGQEIRMQLSMSTNYKDQQVQADQFFWLQDLLNGRSMVDPRVSDAGRTFSMTDTLITNIRNDRGEFIYLETAGIREGLSTLYEISGVLPHNGPFGQVDYYKIVIERSDSQELID